MPWTRVSALLRSISSKSRECWERLTSPRLDARGWSSNGYGWITCKAGARCLLCRLTGRCMYEGWRSIWWWVTTKLGVRRRRR